MITSTAAFRSLNLLAAFRGWLSESEKHPNWTAAIAFACKLFAVFKTDRFRKKITRKGERKEVTAKILMNILEVVLFTDHLCSQTNTSGLYVYSNSPQPSNGPTENGTGISQMRARQHPALSYLTIVCQRRFDNGLISLIRYSYQMKKCI